jgi:hypothetical protein
MFTWYYSSHHRYCSCCSSRPPCGSLHRAVTMPDDTKAAALRARLEAIVNEAEDVEAQDVAASRLPASSRKRSPRPSLWSRRLQLPVSAFHLRLPRPWPRSSSPPPLRPTKTRSSLAAAVLNVRQLVNIVLDSCSTNYVSWHDLMEQALQRYALIKNVTDDAQSNDLGWIRMDSVVLN